MKFILNIVLSVLHTAVFLLLCGMLLNAYIPPKIFGWLGFLALGFPFLMITYVAICIVWMIQWKKRSVLFLAGLLLFFTPTRRWINYSESKDIKEANLKILSFNIKGGLLGEDKISQYLTDQNADVVLLQESGYDDKKNINISTSDKTERVHFPVVTLLTKYKVVDKGNIIEDSTNGHSFYADLDVHGKTIRFINVYLEPYYLEKSMVKPTQNFDNNQEKTKTLIRHMKPNFVTHQLQVEKIKKFIDNSPYPVVVAGDFNSVPNSYEYYQVAKTLQDAFLEVGKGSGTSFHDYKFPIRIDYIFASKSIKPLGYHVDRSVKLSDHYPVIGYFKVP